MKKPERKTKNFHYYYYFDDVEPYLRAKYPDKKVDLSSTEFWEMLTSYLPHNDSYSDPIPIEAIANGNTGAPGHAVEVAKLMQQELELDENGCVIFWVSW